MQVKDLMQPVKDRRIVRGGITGTEDVYLLDLNVIKGKPPVIEVTDEYNRKIGEIPRTMLENILKMEPAKRISDMLWAAWRQVSWQWIRTAAYSMPTKCSQSR